MALSSIEQKRFGLKKETVRGTAETTPNKWFPVLKDAEFQFNVAHLQDEAVRGVAEEYPPIAGIKDAMGNVKLVLDAQTIGEFFNSLLGGVSSAQQGATAAYKHTFTRATSIEKPSYTFFLDRGLSVKKYSLGVVKKVGLTGSVDGLVTADIDILAKEELAGSIGSPTFPSQRYLSFENVSLKLNGAANTDIRSWSLNIDNGAVRYRTVSQSPLATNIIAPGKLDIKGSFVIYFQDEVERTKFLGNTAATFQMTATGPVIAGAFNYAVDVLLPRIHYTAYPWGESENILAANVDFDGKYDSATAKAIEVNVTNTDTAY